MQNSQAIPNRENKMGSMPIGKLLFNMGAPMVASMLFQALYNVVDSVFVARLSQDAMNAVSLAFPIQGLCMAIGIGTGVGINALISRSLGAKEPEKANKAANVGIFLYIVSAFIFAALGFVLSKPFYRFQTSNEQIIAYGSAYISVVLGCSFALFGQVCGERLLQSTGKTTLSMASQITGAVTNMILDPILIFGLFGFPKLEVLGAAIATIIGQFIAATLAFTLNIKYNHEIHLSFKDIRFDGVIAKEIYRVGLPSIIMQSVGSAMNLGINKILIGFTEAATAVFGAYYKIQSFIFLPVFGMNGAMVPILSYNYGAANLDRVKKAVKLAMTFAVSIMILGTILFELIPGTLLGIFSPTDEMLSVGKAAFRIIGTHFPVAGFCIIAGSVCQALDKPIYSMIIAFVRQLVVLLPATYLLSLTGDLDNVWFAFPIAEVVSLIINIFFLRSTFSGAAKNVAARKK